MVPEIGATTPLIDVIDNQTVKDKYRILSQAAELVASPQIRNQGTLGGNVSGQGYISVNGKSVLFPAVGVNKNGSAVVGFTIVAQDMYPSAAYVSLSSTGAGAVNIVAAGAGPDDGFTGYPIVTGTNVGRWGDYSAASADEDGAVWFATEFIPNAPRTILANWGTYIAKVPQ